MAVAQCQSPGQSDPAHCGWLSVDFDLGLLRRIDIDNILANLDSTHIAGSDLGNRALGVTSVWRRTKHQDIAFVDWRYAGALRSDNDRFCWRISPNLVYAPTHYCRLLPARTLVTDDNHRLSILGDAQRVALSYS